MDKIQKEWVIWVAMKSHQGYEPVLPEGNRLQFPRQKRRVVCYGEKREKEIGRGLCWERCISRDSGGVDEERLR